MKEKFFKTVTGIAAAYHILLGVAGFLCPAATVERVIAFAFGLAVEVDPLLSLIVKFSSVYMLAFGIMLLLVSLNPIKYRIFVIPAAVLFGFRLFNRIIFFSTLTDAGMTASRNVVGTGLILFFFVAMLASLPRKED